MQGKPTEITKQSRLGHFLEYAPEGEIYWNFPTFGPKLETKWNKGCFDVSKSRVNEVHKHAFWYSAEVDSLTFQGKFIEKSNLQAKHDGIILTENKEPLEGKVYERFIDSSKGEFYYEYRVFVFNEVRFVMEKKKPIGDLFGWKAVETRFVEIEEVFNIDEVRNINKFCDIFDVQLCELDVLRDNYDGKIYILDVNNMAGGTDDHGIFRACINKPFQELFDLYAYNLSKLY